MKVIGAVLVGRPRLAVQTITKLLDVSPLMRETPIYAFHLPHQRPNPSQMDALSKLGKNVKVKEISLFLPRYRNEDMFYSRKSSYARGFGKSRIGYLDMCYWKTNMFSEPALARSDFLVSFDDDSDFISSPDNRIRDALASEDWVIATARARENNVSQRILDTREHLISFTREFISKNAVEVRDARLAIALKSSDDLDFHSLPWTAGNFNIYRTSEFRTVEWYRWAYGLNLFGASHRLRWGEIEALDLFARLHYPNAVWDMDLVRDGIYRPTAPGAKMVQSKTVRSLIERTFSKTAKLFRKSTSVKSSRDRS